MANKKRKRSRTKNKKKSNFKVKLILTTLVLIGVVTLFLVKDIPIADYYDAKDISGLESAKLKTAIHDRIRKHEYLNFEQNSTARYWWDNYFKKTDWSSNGYFIDMYSNEKHSTYVNGKLQSREHCMPRSWWGKGDKYPSYDANGDLHNIFPSDYFANAAKSNLPLGEVGIAKFSNGVCKVGSNTYPNGYRGQVFEPADEYKGDFARVYFYMVTCYEDYAYSWRPSALKSMLQLGTYPSFQPWALSMLLKWHREDPVSDKEVLRNAEVYYIQGNRNPFVDNPDLVEHIWGNKKDIPFISENEQSPKKVLTVKDVILSYANKINNIVNK